ncbi:MULTISPECIES: ABC transporter substrate-binding protein [Mesotoga]|jgi:sn-glycerol 3-phosphate transport system substrate-binding protein|uniref:ABC transporter substrate-binding protein n=2 Tax=Kosmotogaceae TaxID=1643948 RepID=UPI001BD1CAD6|nr:MULTISPECIES: ABC transporter substrate-binding protein [Mesotoga]MCP5456892.1 ABC transporter substrate-binding protein [Thermotogota bacterium]MCP5461069.1 ABC transporter substrate-binding protein [Thermotogota bacterium]HNS74945.1 ABC transporter substrate-binding protein [Mesotoga prima]HOP37055.1 ABC transporter substrate-binding protein [Mesotoga prima]HPE52808.1 ABC transporter substrate-binding protein [Mesotoga prima]
MKRIITVFALLVFSLTGLGAVTLTFWHSMSDYQKPIIDKLVADFNRSHDGIEVKAIFQGSYDETVTKLKAALLAGKGPDIAQVNIEHIQIFSKDGSLQDLTDLISNDPTLSAEDFVESFWQTIIRDGKPYALPFNISALMLFYNKDHFEAAGLDPNKPPKNWEELEEYARKLTIRKSSDSRPSQYGLLWGVDTMFYQFEPLVWQNGGEIFNEDMTECIINSAEGIEALETWRRWFAEGLSPADLTIDEGIQSFTMGRISMGPMTSGGIRYALENIPWDLGVAPLPEGKLKATTLGGGSLSIMSGLSEEKVKAAWTFIKWMVSEKNTLFWYEGTGYMPVLKSAMDSLEIQLIWQRFPQLKAPIESVVFARPRPVHTNIIEIRNILYNAVEQVRKGVSEPKPAFDEAVIKVNELLK